MTWPNERDDFSCEVCEKDAGKDYCSDDRTCNKGGYGLVLCAPCGVRVTMMSEPEAFVFLAKCSVRGSVRRSMALARASQALMVADDSIRHAIAHLDEAGHDCFSDDGSDFEGLSKAALALQEFVRLAKQLEEKAFKWRLTP